MSDLGLEEPLRNVTFNETMVNMIRGKSLMYKQDVGVEIRTLCRMLDWFVDKLDDSDDFDTFGTEGWRHHFGVEE